MKIQVNKFLVNSLWEKLKYALIHQENNNINI